jgi:mannose-6-phosphate isomerase-like protein (cupin superfamily)
MRNFLRITEGVDMVPLQAALATRAHLWNVNTLRTSHPGTAHGEVDDIWLRFNKMPESPLDVVNDVDCFNYPAFFELPQARSLVFALMARVEGERLGRCLITRLRPGGVIYPHVDQGAPATYYDRFHIVVSGSPGCVFRAGDEKVQMRTGEVWWFDNCQEHEVLNYSADERIHIVVDIRVPHADSQH